MLEIRNLSAGYPGKNVLENIDLTIPTGKITVIAGPNGCGKSTLLKALTGAVERSGQVLLDGARLDRLPSRELAKIIACLPQSRQIPEITAERLVLHGRFPYLSYPRRYSRKDREIVRDAMEQMGIAEPADQLLNTLSGGTRQKVYIAMALAQDTPVILMDEPTTFLDIAHQMQMMDHARFLARSGKTVVLVLHDLSLAMQTADYFVVLSHSRVAAQGTPEDVFQSGCLADVFGIQVRRTSTPEGWQYYYAPAENKKPALV